jgi:hypothetical protein
VGKDITSHSSDGGGNNNRDDAATSIESLVCDEGHVTRNGDVAITIIRKAVTASKNGGLQRRFCGRSGGGIQRKFCRGSGGVQRRKK